jgi:hypothetical protein
MAFPFVKWCRRGVLNRSGYFPVAVVIVCRAQQRAKHGANKLLLHGGVILWHTGEINYPFSRTAGVAMRAPNYVVKQLHAENIEVAATQNPVDIVVSHLFPSWDAMNIYSPCDRASVLFARCRHSSSIE